MNQGAGARLAHRDSRWDKSAGLISICVCTYNRDFILPYCLDSLLKLRLDAPGLDAEIIIIDNNSDDGTAALVNKYSQRSPIKLRYFLEPKQGISNARNRAVVEFKGDYLAFLDDECVVPTDWLIRAWATIREFQPSVMGGPYLGALTPGPVPSWFKVEYGDAYFVSWQLKRGPQQEFRASGCNMFIARDVFRYGQFDKRLGVEGRELKLGEETEFQNRVLALTAEDAVFFEPDIAVRHLIRQEKMSLIGWSKRMMEVGAAGAYRCSKYEVLRNLIKACAKCVAMPIFCLFRDRARFSYWQNFAYERAIPQIAPCFGAAFELVCKRYPRNA